jgi:hypothetical protein
LTSLQLAKWEAYFQIEPAAGERLDWLAPLLVQHWYAAAGRKPPVVKGKLIEWGKP